MVDLRSIAQPLNCAIFFVSVCSGLNNVPIKRYVQVLTCWYIILIGNQVLADLEMILDLKWALNQKMNILMREEHTEKKAMRRWRQRLE